AGYSTLGAPQRGRGRRGGRDPGGYVARRARDRTGGGRRSSGGSSSQGGGRGPVGAGPSAPVGGGGGVSGRWGAPARWAAIRTGGRRRAMIATILGWGRTGRSLPARLLHPLRRWQTRRRLAGRPPPPSIAFVCPGNICPAPY